MTLGRYVLIKRGFERDSRILAHELVHARQWRELGRVRFLYQYLKAYFVGRLKGLSHTEAYRQIPLEAEARRLSGEKS